MPRVNQQVDRLLEKVCGAASLDFTPVFEDFGIQLMASSTFSKEFDHEGPESARSLLDALHQSQEGLGSYGHVPWIYNTPLSELGPQTSSEKFTQIANLICEQRRSIKPDRPDLFSHILKTEGNPDSAGFPIHWEARLAIVAGR